MTFAAVQQCWKSSAQHRLEPAASAEYFLIDDMSWFRRNSENGRHCVANKSGAPRAHSLHAQQLRRRPIRQRRVTMSNGQQLLKTMGVPHQVVTGRDNDDQHSSSCTETNAQSGEAKLVVPS